MKTNDLTYRPDIDGLRAIAVGSVLLFHAFPGRLPGGFTGVDIFFVISGFLITSIISGKAQEDKFSFIDFYKKRIRRIFPALIAVLSFVFIFGWFICLSDEYLTISKNIIGGAAFSANLLFLTQQSYFDHNSSLNPLLHLWSLGVEEQFYIFWPILILASYKFGIKTIWTATTIGVISFIFCIWIVKTDPTQAFFSPAARAWELMVGSAISLLPRGVKPHRLFRETASVAGAVLLAAGLLLITEDSAFPSWNALLPVSGAALFIFAGPDAWLNKRFLSSKPLVGLGLISYPLYLWHWPLLSYALILNFEDPITTGPKLGALAIAVILAWLTYLIIERPIIVRKLVSPGVLAAGMGAVILVTAGVVLAQGAPARAANRDPARQLVASYQHLRKTGLQSEYRSECDFYDWKTYRKKRDIDERACLQPGKDETLFLWGDSHAQALSLGIRSSLPPGTSLAQVATSGCAPSLDKSRIATPANACDDSNRFALQAIARLRPRTVILAQEHNHELTDWLAIARRLKMLGVQNVVLIGPVPQWRPSLPRVVAKRYWGVDHHYVHYGLDPAMIRTNTLLTRAYGASPELTYISLIDKLCQSSGCLAQVPGFDDKTLMAIDYGHLSPQASVYVGRSIIWPRLPK